jgi:hypothetical protein
MTELHAGNAIVAQKFMTIEFGCSTCQLKDTMNCTCDSCEKGHDYRIVNLVRALRLLESIAWAAATPQERKRNREFLDEAKSILKGEHKETDNDA